MSLTSVLMAEKEHAVVRSSRIQFTIPGEPSSHTSQQKGISFRRGIVYTKAAVKAEMRRIMATASKHSPAAPLEGPVLVVAAVYFPLTEALMQKHADQLAELEFSTWKTTKPDADNTGKLIVDALAKCGFFKNDSQVCVAIFAKGYATVPRIEVTLGPLHQAPGRILSKLLAFWEGNPDGWCELPALLASR